MLIFKDALTGDEVLSDSYPIKLVDDIVYECDCSMIQIGGAGDIDIGANASAEDAAEALEDGAETVNNVVYSFRLQPTSFDKKSYMSHLKGYMKAVKAKLQEKGADADTISAFEKGAQTYVKEKLIPNFKDLEFYTGESMDVDGMVIMLNYREDGTTPFVIVWKHGLDEMKV